MRPGAGHNRRDRWMKMKLRKLGTMRKLFILGGRTKNKDVWDKRPEAIFTSGNALTTGIQKPSKYKSVEDLQLFLCDLNSIILSN